MTAPDIIAAETPPAPVAFPDPLPSVAPAADASAELEAARTAGFSVLDDPNVVVDPDALRLLPEDPEILGIEALAIGCSGGVLSVVSPTVPSPAQFSELSGAAGMPVAVEIATPEVWASLTGLYGSRRDDLPRSVGPALVRAIELGASDVHLTAGKPPVIRLGGSLKTLAPWAPLSASDLEHAARWIAGDDVMDDFVGDHDCPAVYGGSRWRVNIYRQRQNLAMALRQIPAEVPPIESLGLPGAVADLAELHQGLVLFVGPTGSGKTTSLSALIDRINKTRPCHIVTIEDPVEYEHRDRVAMIHQREVGEDTPTFAAGLRHVLRQDPDVLLVGEMRDHETMQIAVTAAETGHLVFATVHAESAAGAFTRIIDVFPPSQQDQIRTQLAATLRAVVVQTLVPRIDVENGRQLVCEVLIANTAVRNIVRDKRLHELTSVMESGGELGMCSMDKALAMQVAAHRIDYEDAAARALDPKNFESHLERARRMAVDFDPSGF